MTWVDVTTAIGTAGAAVVALALGLRAEWRAIRDGRQTRVENERRQAIRVAAWMLVEQDDGEGPREIDQQGLSFKRRKARVYEVVQNASEEPVWDVVVYAPIFSKDTQGSGLVIAQAKNGIMCIEPHGVYKSEITVSTIKYNRFPLWVEFRDNAGREWSRDGEGRLHRGRVSSSAFIRNETVGKKGIKRRRRTSS